MVQHPLEYPDTWGVEAVGSGGWAGGCGSAGVAHDDGAPGGAVFQTSREEAETLVHARQPTCTSKGPEVTGERRDLWKSSLF